MPGYIVTLVGTMPPQRFDNVPFTRVHVQEAPAPVGPWVQIDDQALAPLDADPSKPQARNVTTSNGTLLIGWYRLIFLDAAGAQSLPSDAIRNVVQDDTLPPSPDAVRNFSPLLRKRFPLPPTDPYQMPDLRNMVYEATALVQGLTWRTIDPTLGCAAPEGYLCEDVPTALIPVAFRAVGLMSERIFVTSAPRFAEQVATGRRLSSFHAGPYGESYFAPGEFMRRGVVSRPAMDADDALDAALWALATEDARDYFVWRNTGIPLPAGEVSAFDYRRESIGYRAGESPGLGGGYARGGPDGF